MNQFGNKELLYTAYSYNSDLESSLIDNNIVYFPNVGVQFSINNNKNKTKWYKKLFTGLFHMVCIICLLCLPILEIVFGILNYNNEYVQCDVLHSIQLPLWMIIKGTFNVFIILYVLWAIRVKNMQHDNGEPLNDHRSHDSLIALSCIVMICAAILVIWLIAGISLYIVGYCADLSQNKIMDDLMRASLIFELIKYIFVIPLIKFRKNE